MNKGKQKVAISGTSGFVGGKLERRLKAEGYDLISLNRTDFSKQDEELAKKLTGVSAVIHLAGAPVMKRWTDSHRAQIYDSRITTTRQMVGVISKMDTPPQCFICASAVGIYPDTGLHDEQSIAVSEGFLGRVCTDWEQEAMQAHKICRTLLFRFGIILGNDGGALKQMLLPFRLGIGGRIGSGKQMMSWIHIDDVLESFRFSLSEKQLHGPINITAPNPVTNKEFTKVLSKSLRRPAIIPVPEFMLKLVFGAGATVLTGGQNAIPGKLLKHGFEFRHSRLESALDDLLR